MNARPDPPPGNPALQLLRSLVLDLGAPIGLYYGLRAAGVGDILALTAGVVVPALNTLWMFIRQRKVSRLGLFAVAVMVASVVLSLTTGSPRLLLIRDGWITGAVGIAFLVTVRGKAPLAFTFSRPFLERQFVRQSGSWDELWRQRPWFRHIWRVTTAIWGIGLLIDSGIRSLMAYTLPVHVVPALNGTQYGVFTMVMLMITNVYHMRSGLWLILTGAPPRADGAP